MRYVIIPRRGPSVLAVVVFGWGGGGVGLPARLWPFPLPLQLVDEVSDLFQCGHPSIPLLTPVSNRMFGLEPFIMQHTEAFATLVYRVLFTIV